MTHPAHATRILLVTLVAPLVITLATLIVTFDLASRLPGRVAVHWNAAGVPDGFGSPYTFPILIAVICLPLDAVFGGIAVLTSHRSSMTVMTKILGVAGIWISVLLAVVLGGAVALDHGAASSGRMPLVWLPIAIALASALTVGAWFLLPKAAKSPRGDGTPVAAVALGSEERASWIRSVTAPVGLIWGFVGFMVLITVIVLFSVLARDRGIWPISFIPIAVLLIVLTNFAWTIRVDSRGVRVRSSIGIPTITVPLANIESADVVDVQALAQYGGYGFRWGFNGRFGVILRSGEALEILRRNKLSLVVTVDDAAAAAALINGLVKRASVTLP